MGFAGVFLFLFSFASSFGTFYRFFLESFDCLGPLFWGEEGTLPTSPTSPNLYCISPDSQTVLHHTPHFEILPPCRWMVHHGGMLGWVEQHVTFGNLKLQWCNVQHPQPGQPSDSRCQPYLRYNGAPHGAPWETPLEWSNEHMIYINIIKYIYIHIFWFQKSWNKRDDFQMREMNFLNNFRLQPFRRLHGLSQNDPDCCENDMEMVDFLLVVLVPLPVLLGNTKPWNFDSSNPSSLENT